MEHQSGVSETFTLSKVVLPSLPFIHLSLSLFLSSASSILFFPPILLVSLSACRTSVTLIKIYILQITAIELSL